MNGNPGIPVRTPAIEAQILLSVRKGVPKTVAAQALGVSLSTFYLWQREEPDFVQAMKEAQSAWVADMIAKAAAVVETGGRESANMIQWLLERRAFQFFSRKEMTKGHVGDPDDEPGIEAATLDAADGDAANLRHIARLLADAGYTESLEESRAEGQPIHTNGALASGVGVNGREGTNGGSNGVPPAAKP